MAAFFLPMRRAGRQNWADREVSRDRAADRAHWFNMSASHTFPLVVAPERRLPPVMLLPEAILRERWLPDRKAALRPGTYDSYRANIEQHIVLAIGHIRRWATKRAAALWPTRWRLRGGRP